MEAYIIGAYGFVIKRNTTLTASEFSETIRSQFDTAEPRNKAVVEYIIKTGGCITRDIFGELKWINKNSK